MGYFHALKLAFLSSLIRKYMLWEGFYHNFSTKKVSASGGEAPWPPPRSSAPWTPARGRYPLDPRSNFAPSNDLPWRRPCLSVLLSIIVSTTAIQNSYMQLNSISSKTSSVSNARRWDFVGLPIFDGVIIDRHPTFWVVDASVLFLHFINMIFIFHHSLTSFKHTTLQNKCLNPNKQTHPVMFLTLYKLCLSTKNDAKYMRAKSKIGHHCDGWNFFFQLSFFSSHKPRHFMYITWINNHCTPQKQQWGAAMIKHVTVATHLKVRQMEFCSKIPSISKIHFRLSCFSSCVILHREYTTP